MSEVGKLAVGIGVELTLSLSRVSRSSKRMPPIVQFLVSMSDYEFKGGIRYLEDVEGPWLAALGQTMENGLNRIAKCRTPLLAV